MASSVHGFAAPLYYGDPAVLAAVAVGETALIDGAEARHAAGVRRVRPGERASVGDGAGLVLTGTVTAAGQDRVAIQVERRVVEEGPRTRLALVQALAKGDRDERAIQAATEVGVWRVVPWAASRSVAQWTGSKQERGRGRWESIVREASKQSLRAWIPAVDGLADLAAVSRSAEQVIVLDPGGEIGYAAALGRARGAGSIALVVGPEGGIAPEELARLRAAGATVCVLGDTVLRTSTAGPVALAIAQTLLGSWQRGPGEK